MPLCGRREPPFPKAASSPAFSQTRKLTGSLWFNPSRRSLSPATTIRLTNGRKPHRPSIAALNSETPRFKVTVTEDAEFLARKDLLDFKLVVLNYCNWEKPGLSDAAKSNFVRFLRKGGGLTLIHFSNGAFHFSLPKAAESDWPEYRKICRRVWDHSDKQNRARPLRELPSGDRQSGSSRRPEY